MSAGEESEMDGRRIELMLQPSNSIRELRHLQDLRRVVSLRDSNIIEVEDSAKEKTLCTLSQNHGQSVYINTGSFLIVEESAREKTGEAGRNVTAARMLSDEQVLALRKSPLWPSGFQDPSHEARSVTEFPALSEAPKTPVEPHHEKAQGAAARPVYAKVLKGLAGQNGGGARGALMEAPKGSIRGNRERAPGSAELPATPETPKVPAEKVRVAAKSPVSVEIPNALGERNSERAHSGAEPPAPVGAPTAPGERNGVKARSVKPPAVAAAPKPPVEQNGEKSHVATDLPASVEALVDPAEQGGEKLRVVTESFMPVEAGPQATTEQNSKKAQGPPELTAPVLAPKAMGKQNGQKAGEFAKPFPSVDAPKAVAENNAQKSRGGAEGLAPVDVPSAEKNSGDKEADNWGKNKTHFNGSSLWTGGGTDVSWEIAENPSVLGPGPTDDEKGVENKPTPAKELHIYFMIRIPKLSESKGKTEIRMAELRFKEAAEKRDFVNAAIQMKRASRTEALHKLKAAREKVRACNDAIRQKRDEISPLQGALKKLRDTGRQARDKSRDLPSSEQELDNRIAYCEYRIQHESIPLKEEKQLLREIKSLKDSREVVCANEALHVEFSESLGEREDIQERLKPLMSEFESLKAEWTIATKTSSEVEAEFEEMDKALSQVQNQYTAANQVRQAAYDERAALIRQENAQNDEFYQNRREIQHVRQLAFKKEKQAVEELCNAQVERVMSLWNSNNEFRAAYVKSNEKSTLKRLQTFDGRALGPDEEPPLISGDSNDSLSEPQIEIASSASHVTSQRGLAAVSHDLVVATSDIQRKSNHLESLSSSDPNGQDFSARGGSGAVSHGQEEKEEEDLAAAAELKQKGREEQMAKARDAQERKKRSAQRLQSKALARAQKEADRLEKEKEKRSQKKAARLVCSSQEIIPATEGVHGDTKEAERVLDVVQETPAKSGPSTRSSKKSYSQISRTRTPVVSSMTKKHGVRLPTQFWRVGLVVLLAIVAFLTILYYNS